MICQNCSAPLGAGAKFCKNCGATTNGMGQPQPAPQYIPHKESKPKKFMQKALATIAALALIVYGPVSIITAIQFDKNGIVTTATVTSMHQHQRDTDEGDSPFEKDIYYNYTVDGKEYTGNYMKKFKSGEPIVPPETVQIMYLPDRPQVSKVAGNSNIALSLASGVGMFALGIVIIWVAYRRKKPSKGVTPYLRDMQNY